MSTAQRVFNVWVFLLTDEGGNAPELSNLAALTLGVVPVMLCYGAVRFVGWVRK